MTDKTIFENLTIETDIWHYLQSVKKPIVLYGMGNGADKILAVFEKLGIEAADFFASDEFVRGQLFHEKRVLTYAQTVEKYGDFIIVVAFGSHLPEVIARIRELAAKHELYIPDVPVAGGELFDLAYYNAHRDELSEVYSMLYDELSRRTFRDVVLYRLTGKLEYLNGHTVGRDEVYTGILSAPEYRNAADLGAYNGDSLRELWHYANRLEYAAALEPDSRTFRKLAAFSESQPYKIDAHNAAAWDCECELQFTSGANRNSTLITSDGVKTGAKLVNVKAISLDSLGLQACDYIKYDVEGAERRALVGSRETIEKFHPELLVSLYHCSEDIFRLPKLVREFGYSRLYLRRYEAVPAWDLNLLARYE